MAYIVMALDLVGLRHKQKHAPADSKVDPSLPELPQRQNTVDLKNIAVPGMPNTCLIHMSAHVSAHMSAHMSNEHVCTRVCTHA